MPPESSRRKSIALGVVGFASAWEESYREVIRRQAKPVTLRGIYHTVPALADQTARDWQSWIAPSLTSLFERPEIDAVLVLDTAWHGLYALELAIRWRKPVLITGPWREEISRLEQIHLAAREAGVLLMAAFPRRHSPATNRLRELMATQLGPAKSITVHVPGASEQAQDQLTELIDWCSSIFGRQPIGITATRDPDLLQIDLRFPSPDLKAVIRLTPGDETAAAESLVIDCQHGSAVLIDDTQIAWSIGSQQTHNTLTSDRPSAEIILDQFCRRVVGGLVPVADLGDVLRSARLAQEVTK